MYCFNSSVVPLRENYPNVAEFESPFFCASSDVNSKL